MQILIDGRPCENDAESIGEAIAAGAAVVEPDRRIIEVYVDGELLSADELTEADRLQGCAAEVRLISAEPRAMARESLLQSRDALREIDSLQQAAAELIQTDQMQEAMEKMLAALAHWQLVQHVIIKAAELAAIDLAALHTNAGTFDEHVADLGGRLRAIGEALKSSDSIALADILLYEMPQVIERWRELLERAADHAGAHRGGHS